MAFFKKTLICLNIRVADTLPGLNLTGFKFKPTHTNPLKPVRIRVQEFSVKGSRWYRLAGVCLATQSTLDRMESLPELVTSWHGRVSVAVFVPDVEHSMMLYLIEFLISCFPDIKERASFHFIYPLGYPPVNFTVDKRKNMTCDQLSHIINDLLSQRPNTTMTWRKGYAYPQNFHRNIARRSCQTEYVFTPDIDMIPNPSLYQDLTYFLSRQSNCTKCA